MGAWPTKKGRKEPDSLLIDWKFDPDIRKSDASLFSITVAPSCSSLTNFSSILFTPCVLPVTKDNTKSLTLPHKVPIEYHTKNDTLSQIIYPER
jgi:hypothetical protein